MLKLMSGKWNFGELSFDTEYRLEINSVTADTFSCTYYVSISCQTSV